MFSYFQPFLLMYPYWNALWWELSICQEPSKEYDPKQYQTRKCNQHLRSSCWFASFSARAAKLERSLVEIPFHVSVHCPKAWSQQTSASPSNESWNLTLYKWKLVDWGSLCPKLLLIHPRLNSDLLWNWEKEYDYIQHPGCNEQNIISENIKSFLKIGIHCFQWWYIMPGICQEKACKICHCWFSLAILPFRHGGSWTQLRFLRCFLDPLQLQPHGFKEPTCWYVCPIWCPTSTGAF